MSYYANGSVRIEATEANLTSAALLFDSIGKRMSVLDDIREDMQAVSGSFMVRVLTACGFSDPTEEKLEDGRIVFQAPYDAKWGDASNFVHFLAAESGMDIRASFRGEDNEGWAWSSDNGQALEDVLEDVAAYELEQLRESDTIIKSVREALSSTNSASAEELLDQVRKLVSGVPEVEHTRYDS